MDEQKDQVQMPGSIADNTNVSIGANTDTGVGSGFPQKPSPTGFKVPGLHKHQMRKWIDWKDFCDYLQKMSPPVLSSSISSAHIIEYLKHLDQFGETKVHITSCPYYGKLNSPVTCTCPLRQAAGTLLALVKRLRFFYDEHISGCNATDHETNSNPFGSIPVLQYLKQTRDMQAKALGIPFNQKITSTTKLEPKKPFNNTTTKLDESSSQKSMHKESFFSSRRISTSNAREIKAYEDMLQSLDSINDVASSTPPLQHQECFGCLFYCCLFLKDRHQELESDTLVQLWMAAGLIKEEPMEDIASAYLLALEFQGIICFFREDHGTGRIWYKVNESAPCEQILEILKPSIGGVNAIVVHFDHDSMNSSSLTETEPCRIVLFWHLLTDLRVVEKIPHLIMLLSSRHGQESQINCMPYDFFMSLKFLQALDLSGTRISELPSSLGSAKCLHYLDLSRTSLKRLPETIDCLQLLQTLKLQNCPHLTALPKGTARLMSLRHLDLGTICRLSSMPTGIGAVIGLRTLSHFVVARNHGCHIGELKNLDQLSGKFRLSRLENIASLDEVKDANLRHKWRLTKLELCWSPDHEHEIESLSHDIDQVIEHLRPPTTLKDLRILCYGGSKFPSWISDLSFDNLATITLFKCENCQFLPSLGQLPSLETLSLLELTGVTIIDLCFCRSEITTGDGDHFVAFPALKKLEIKSMVSLEEWRRMGKDDFPQLTKLTINNCPELVALSRLSNLQSLEYLEIIHCSKLPFLLQSDLPTSVLKTLVIEDCPLIYSTMNCSMEGAKDWLKVQNSPSVLIYQRNGVSL